MTKFHLKMGLDSTPETLWKNNLDDGFTPITFFFFKTACGHEYKTAQYYEVNFWTKDELNYRIYCLIIKHIGY